MVECKTCGWFYRVHVDQVTGALVGILDAIESILGVDLVVLLGLAVAGLVGVIASPQINSQTKFVSTSCSALSKAVSILLLSLRDVSARVHLDAPHLCL